MGRGVDAVVLLGWGLWAFEALQHKGAAVPVMIPPQP